MEERHYRLLLALLAGLAVVVMVVRAASFVMDDLAATPSVHDLGRLLGLGLLPIAAIGLWSWKRWGFWTLGLATLVAILTAIPDGLFAAFWRTILHLTMILLTVEQHLTRTLPGDEEPSDHDQGPPAAGQGRKKSN